MDKKKSNLMLLVILCMKLRWQQSHKTDHLRLTSVKKWHVSSVSTILKHYSFHILVQESCLLFFCILSSKCCFKCTRMGYWHSIVKNNSGTFRIIVLKHLVQAYTDHVKPALVYFISYIIIFFIYFLPWCSWLYLVKFKICSKNC